MAREIRGLGSGAPRRDVIVVGGSAGAVKAFIRLAESLPPTLRASILVVIHLSALHRSHLPQIVDRRGPLRATRALDGAPYQPGNIYFAPPDAHLLVEDGKMRLSDGPPENAVRPAIDTLFRSAARTLQARVVGVILSGTLNDGARGLLEVKSQGGLTLVQDPAEAGYPEMPRHAIEVCRPDAVAPVTELAGLLGEALLPGPDTVRDLNPGRVPTKSQQAPTDDGGGDDTDRGELTA